MNQVGTCHKLNINYYYQRCSIVRDTKVIKTNIETQDNAAYEQVTLH